MNDTQTQARRSGFVAILGRPNVGKSTLMNALIGQKIAITSHRPQTTREKILTIYTEERGQIVFLDTPGIIQDTKNRLGEYMMKVVRRTTNDADLLLYLIGPEPVIGSGDRAILTKLKDVSIPVLLVVNKTDTVDPSVLLQTIECYRNELDFSEVIPVSALKKRNLDELLNCIFAYLPEGPDYYGAEEVTDLPIRAICAELIREKTLQLLSDEVPHGIAVLIDRMEERRDGSLTEIEAAIVCEKDSHKSILIGKNGSMIKKIGSAARYEIEHLLEQKVFLKLFVKVRKDWRNSDTQLKNFGSRERS